MMHGDTVLITFALDGIAALFYRQNRIFRLECSVGPVIPTIKKKVDKQNRDWCYDT